MTTELFPKFANPACRGADPRLFFPNSGGVVGKADRDRATRYCQRCPHMDECRDWAVNNITNHADTGIWGGTNAEERRELRRQHEKAAA